MADELIERLQAWVRQRPIAIIRTTPEEWAYLSDSRRGVSEFTMARSHSLFEHLKTPTLCLVYPHPEVKASWLHKAQDMALLGIIRSKERVTSLETRARITRAVQILPTEESGLHELIEVKSHSRTLLAKLAQSLPIVVLSPELSASIIQGLASIPENQAAIRIVAAGLNNTKRFSGPKALQEDAIQTALKAFGLDSGHRAERIDLTDQETQLENIAVREDTVIQYDAQTALSGYEYMGGSLTGRAIFEKNGGRLEIITANRQKLEEVFGVDLIYLNLAQKNLVMLQYKMLDRGNSKKQDDWIYRPDEKLEEELERMERFCANLTAPALDYRLNSQAFYLKFVKRNGLLTNGSILTPLDHYRYIIASSKGKGPRSGVRISYTSLAGTYMRNGTFIDLMQAGYIGTFAEETNMFNTLITAVLNDNRAVIAALQQETQKDPLNASHPRS